MEQEISQNISQRNEKRPDLIQIFWSNYPYLLFGFGQIIMVLAFIYPNENRMHFFESSIARGSASFFISYFIMVKQGQSMTQNIINNSKVFKFLMIRNLLIIVYSNVFSLSQLYLSLPIVQTINCAGPVFTFLADFMYNSVKIDKTQGHSIFIVILGSVFISNKNFILNLFNSLEAKDFHQKQLSQDDYLARTGLNMDIIIGFLLFVAVCGWGIAQVMVKKLSMINSSVINVHFAYFYMITSGVGYPVMVQNPLDPMKILYAFFLCGIPTTIAALCMIKASQMTKNTGVLTLMSFNSVIVGQLVNIFRYNEQLNFVSLFGMINIFGGLAAVLVQQKKIRIKKKGQKSDMDHGNKYFREDLFVVSTDFSLIEKLNFV